MAFTELQEKIPKASQPVPPATRVIVVKRAKKDHPWRRAIKTGSPGLRTGRSQGRSLTAQTAQQSVDFMKLRE
jgi:hypothetical protein